MCEKILTLPLPKAEGGFAPDACFVCWVHVNWHATIVYFFSTADLCSFSMANFFFSAWMRSLTLLHIFKFYQYSIFPLPN